MSNDPHMIGTWGFWGPLLGLALLNKLVRDVGSGAGCTGSPDGGIPRLAVPAEQWGALPCTHTHLPPAHSSATKCCFLEENTCSSEL